jgi:hemerythrin superfamily protein
MGLDDIVARVLADHRDIQAQFEAVAEAEVAEWRGLFFVLAESLVRHEVAEEKVLYPVVCLEPGGVAIAQARVAEQSEVLELISQMEQMAAESGEFAESFDLLYAAVLEHASAEEDFVLPMLQEQEERSLLVEMGRRYLELKNSAPPSSTRTFAQLAEAIRDKAPALNRRTLSPKLGSDRQDDRRVGRSAGALLA